MPTSMRSRRFKPIFLFVVLFTLTVLYLTSSARQTRDSGFYQRTQAELLEKTGLAKTDGPVTDSGDASGLPGSEADVAQRLKDTEEQAKARTDQKGDELRAQMGMDELPEKSEVAEKPKPKPTPDTPAPRPVKKPTVQKPAEAQKPVKDAPAAGPETKEEHKVEGELDSILKRSPIIIFSKSYCPYSMKAKRILLEQYKITPPPYVVELDKHDLGAELQASLAESTGRRTVPNVLVMGKSIGGGDDIEELHVKGQLLDTIKSMGGKRITEAIAVQNDADSDSQDDTANGSETNAGADDNDDDDEEDGGDKAEI